MSDVDVVIKSPETDSIEATQEVEIEFVHENRVVSVPQGGNLRSSALDHKVDLYTLKGKLGNCGGYGQCGTCVVDVIEGMENLSPLTAVEERRLRKKPQTCRLACQVLVEGPVKIMTKPSKRR